MNDWATKLRLTEREKQYGLPAGLLSAVMNQESAGNPGAVSPKGARGLFQFMPDTAQGYGINPDDPEQAAEGAARMYSDLLKQHKGDLDMALAGYNWGSGNMAKHGMENMPAETRNYISSIKSKLPPQMNAANGMDSVMGGAGGDTIDDPFAALPDAAPVNPNRTSLTIRPQNFQPTAATSPAAIDDPFAALPDAAPAPAVSPIAAAAATPHAPTAPGRPFGESLQLGVQNVGRGMADLFGAPVDLTTAAMNLGSAGINKIAGTNIPPITEPFLGSDSIANAFGTVTEAAGGKLVPTDNLSTPEKLTRNVTRFGTSALGGGAAALRGATVGAVEQAVPRLQPLANSFTEAYSTAPGRAMINDVGAATGAGVGSTVANEIAPDSPTAEFVGTALGSIGGHGISSVAQGGKDAVVKSAKNLVTGGPVDTTLPRDPQSKLPTDRKAADAVADYMQRQVANPAEAKATLADNFKFYQGEGLPTPTTGTMTGDPGAIGVEKTLRTSNPTPFIQRDQLLRQAQADKLKQLGPGIDDANKRDAQTFAKQTADTEIGTAAAVADGKRTALDKGKADLTAAKQAEVEIPAPIAAARGTGPQASAQLDQQLNEGALKPKTKARNEAVDAVDPNREIMRDAKPFIETARNIKSQVGKLSPDASGLPPELLSKLEKLDAKEIGTDFATGKKITTKAEVSIGDMLDSRKYLSGAANKAQSAGNYELADNLRLLKKQANEEVDRLIAEGGPGADRAAAMKSRQEEYAPFFSEGFGRKYRDKLQKDPTGRTVLPPSKTAALFLDDVPEAAADLKRIMSIADNPADATRAAGNYLKADLATRIGADGALQPKTLKAWMDTRKAQIDATGTRDEFDTLYKDVLNGREKTNKSMQQVDTLQNELKAAEGDLSATQQRVDKSVLRTLIDNEPQNAAAKILGDGDPEARMKETIGRLKGNEGAMKAWRQAVADHIETKMTGTRTELTGNESYAVQQGKVEGFLKKPGVDKALQTLYADQPEAMNALRVAQKIGRDVAKQNIQASTGSITAESTSRLNKALLPVELVMRAKMGSLAAGSHMRSLKLVLGSIPGLNQNAAIERLLIRSQFEPELAIALYGRNVEKMPAAVYSKKIRKLLNRAAVAREIVDDDKTDDE